VRSERQKRKIPRPQPLLVTSFSNAPMSHVGHPETPRSAPVALRRQQLQAWDSLDALNAWYKGADYQAALKIGEKYATFRRYAVEGQ
jgi:uncharacterized protein (DUF1330 family)